VAVVPGEVERHLLLESSEAVRDQGQAPRAFGLDRPYAPLDYRQAAMLAQRPEAMLNAPTPTPPSEFSCDELFAPVGNKVPRCLPRVPEEPLKEVSNRCRRGLRAIDRESHHTPGEVVDGDREPPAEGPDLRQGEGNPGGPEAECSGDGGQVYVPEMIRLPGGHDTRGRLRSIARLGLSRIVQHPPHRGGSEMETRPGEDLSYLHLPQRWAEDSEPLHEVGDEIGESVHRFGQADEGIRALLIETPHPGGDPAKIGGQLHRSRFHASRPANASRRSRGRSSGTAFRSTTRVFTAVTGRGAGPRPQ